MGRIRLPSDVKIAEVIIKSPRNSFFSKISKLASARLVLEVNPIPDQKKYVVFAYSYGRSFDNYISLLIKSDATLKRSKILRIKYWEDNGLQFIYALKARCEFYRIAEDNNIAILSPYMFDKGARKFVALGDEKDFMNYEDKLLGYYGEDNVVLRYIDTADRLGRLLAQHSPLGIVLDKLTSKELKVLNLAYSSGYLDYPREISLETLGSNLGLSKVTISIHLRKAFKKIIEEIMRFNEQ